MSGGGGWFGLLEKLNPRPARSPRALDQVRELRETSSTSRESQGRVLTGGGSHDGGGKAADADPDAPVDPAFVDENPTPASCEPRVRFTDDPFPSDRLLTDGTGPHETPSERRNTSRRLTSVSRRSTTDIFARRESTFLPFEALDDDEEDAYRRFFGQLDTTMDGTIPVSELVAACRLLQMPLSRREIEDAFQTLDDGDGRVEVTEFLTFMSWAKATGCLRYRSEKLNWVVSKVLSDRLMNDERNESRRKVLMSLSPSGKESQLLRDLCDLVVLTLSCYYGVVVPLHFAVVEHGDSWKWYDSNKALLPCEIVFSVFLLADVLMFKVRLSVHQSSRFSRVINTIPALPIDLVGYAAGLRAVHSFGYVLRVLAVFKIESLFRLRGKTALLTASVATWVFEIAPVVRLVAYVTLFSNLFSCLFLVTKECDNCASLQDRYLEAVYWAMYTISSVGYGDVPVDTRGAKVLSVVMFLISICVNGFFVGKITSLMVVDSKAEHRETMARTRQILSQFQIPLDMREDVLSLQNHLLEMKFSLNSFHHVIQGLPHAVQESLSLYLRVQQLMQVPLFQSVSAHCQVALAECLRSRIVARDEYLTVEGDSANAMFFITHGFAEVVKQEKRLALLMPGAFFGEMPLIRDEALHVSTTRTLSYTEVLILGRDDFVEITGRFPTLKGYIEVSVARQRGETPPAVHSFSEQKGNLQDAISRRLQKKRLSFRGQIVSGDAHEDPEMRIVRQDDRESPPVRFYGYAGEWGQLCSFWPSTFTSGGKEYPSIEHFFQAMKFEGTVYADQIRLAPGPEEARNMGKDRSKPLRPDWEQVKEKIMQEGLFAKFTQCLDCSAVLRSTGNRKLLFSDSADDFWGIGPSGSGRNRLGVMLMIVRQHLREDTVRFFGYTGPYGRLSNFFPSPFTLQGRRWATVEHYFQGMKWAGQPRMEEVAAANTAVQALQIGTEERPGETVRSDWQVEREAIMMTALRAKFQSDETCRRELLSTGAKRIIFDDTADDFWGGGEDGCGANRFGYALEIVRAELAVETTASSSGNETVPTTPPAGGQFEGPSNVSFPHSVGSHPQVRSSLDTDRTSNESDEVEGAPVVPPPVRRETTRQGKLSGARRDGTPHGDEMLDLVLQLRDTQLQQQEFINSSVQTLLANQRIIAKRLRQIITFTDSWEGGTPLGIRSDSGFMSTKGSTTSSFREPWVRGRRESPLSRELEELDADFPFGPRARGGL